MRVALAPYLDDHLVPQFLLIRGYHNIPLEGPGYLLPLEPQQSGSFLTFSPGLQAALTLQKLIGLEMGKPNSIDRENEYQKSWAHYMLSVAMTVEEFLLSDTMTLMTLLCQSDDQVIEFLTREIVSVMTVPFLLFTVSAVLRHTL